MTDPRSRPWRKFVAKLTIAVLSPVIFLAICELVCAVGGVRVPRYHALHAEVDYWVPYEEPGKPAGLQRVVSRNFKNYPEKLPLFAAAKPSNGFRVFTLGESSVQGSPYEIGSFTDWLQLRLAAMMPDRTVEAVNAGNAGWHATEIRTLLRECLQYQPDLLVWMVGHNEFAAQNLLYVHEHVTNPLRARTLDFVRSLRTTQFLSRWIPGLVQADRVTLSDRKNADDRRCVNDDELLYIQKQYRDTVFGAIADAKKAGVPMVICTMPRNLKCMPSGSYVSEELHANPELKKKWENLYQQGTSALNRRDARTAMLKFDEALKIDDSPSKLHFSIGRAAEMLGRAERARAEYAKALDLDACPNRALPWIQQIIREAAVTEGVALTDLEKAFDEAGKLGIAGDELICDNVHPTLAGHERIAEELLLTFENNLKIPLDRSKDIKGKAGRAALGTDDYDTKFATRSECLINLRLVLSSGDTGPLWKKTYDLAKSAWARDANDYEIFGTMGLLEVLADELEPGRAKIETAMKQNSFVKMQYIFFHKMEPPFRRVLDKASIDIAAAEASLNDGERKILANRIAIEKKK